MLRESLNKEVIKRKLLTTWGMVLSFAALAIMTAGSISLAVVRYKDQAVASTKIVDPTGAVMQTNFGDIEIEFNPNAPIAKSNFVKMVRSGIYDKTQFHRIVTDFMIQGGDPLTKDTNRKSEWGHGGPGFTFADEIDKSYKMTAGTVAFANTGPNSNGSQFFILAADASWLDGYHTVLGKVVSGMDVVDAIARIKAGVTGIPDQEVILRQIILK